jgi:hypothetical protein
MALADIVSGIFGGSAGKEDMKTATGLSKEAVEQLKKLRIPEIELQKIALTNPELAGLLSAETIDGSALEGVSTDPRMKQAQLKALEELSGLSQQGLGAEDRAAFNQLQRESAAQAQAQAQQVLQNAAARGTLDSGSTVMAQLMAGQQAANRSQQGGEAMAAQAAAARRAALGQYADMSSSMANTDFAQKAQIANARDNISQFNAQAKTGANQFNLQNKQNIANTTAQNANVQEMHNKGLHQQKFQNELQKAGGTATQLNNLAGMYSQQGQAAAQGQSQMMGSLIGAGASMGAAYAGKK